MVYTELSLFCAGMLAGSLLIALFLMLKAWKGGDLKLLFFLLLDLTTVVILPFALISLATLSTAAIQGLSLSTFLFQLAISVSYFLFNSTAKRLLIPFASLFLLFDMLQSFLGFSYGSYEFEIGLFAYSLKDGITLATFSVLFLTALIPFYRQMNSRINMLIGSKRLSDMCNNVQPKDSSAVNSILSEGQTSPLKDSHDAFLRNAEKCISEGKYGLCIESCDAEAERIILSRLQLYSIKLDVPVSLQDQISMLESKGISVPSTSILRLRELRNTLATSSGEVTVDQAKWAIRVVSKIAKVLANSYGSQPKSMESRQLEYNTVLPLSEEHSQIEDVDQQEFY